MKKWTDKKPCPSDSPYWDRAAFYHNMDLIGLSQLYFLKAVLDVGGKIPNFRCFDPLYNKHIDRILTYGR